VAARKKASPPHGAASARWQFAIPREGGTASLNAKIGLPPHGRRRAAASSSRRAERFQEQQDGDHIRVVTSSPAISLACGRPRAG